MSQKHRKPPINENTAQLQHFFLSVHLIAVVTIIQP